MKSSGSVKQGEASNRPLRRSSRLANLEDRNTASSSEPPKKQRRPKQKSKVADHKAQNDGKLTDKPSKPLYKLSSMVFADVNAPAFGLAQEKLADEPLKVLIACVFLTRTKGAVSMPVCRELFRRYPTAESLMNANIADVVSMFQPLGLQNRRARTVINLATAWHKTPAEHGKRYRKLHYPSHKDGSDIAPSEQPIEDELKDPRIAWEVGHIPGVGAYALDSWRIFCRDTLRGIPDGLQDITIQDGIATEKRQEWTRVIPLDKELIAYIRWRWLRLGYLWNPVDGTKIKVDQNIITRLQDRELKSYKGFENPWIVYSARLEEKIEEESALDEIPALVDHEDMPG